MGQYFKQHRNQGRKAKGRDVGQGSGKTQKKGHNDEQKYLQFI